VDAVVEGSVERAGNQVRITAQLIDAANDKHLWAKIYERDLRDVLHLQDDVAQAIASEIRIKLTPEQKVHLASARPVSPDAYEAYLRGRYYLAKRSEEGLRKALVCFQDAVQKDPNSALPYAGLADADNFFSYFQLLRPQEARPEAKVAALKALKLDPGSAEAHTALARVMAEYEWDWQGAEREYQRAIELNSSYVTAHQYYGLYLSDMGRHPEAIAEGKKAVELDPLSLPVRNSLAARFQLARRYDDAIEQFSKALEMDANFSFARSNLGWTYVLKKAYEQGTAELLRTISLSGPDQEVLSRLGYAYAASGHRSKAQKELAELKHMASQRYVAPAHVARIYVALGDQTRALAWLEKSYQDRSLGEFDLLVDAGLDSLHSDPRFQDLLRRMNFPP
jgi:tetratricopeptide (TPR) repeat protein